MAKARACDHGSGQKPQADMPVLRPTNFESAQFLLRYHRHWSLHQTKFSRYFGPSPDRLGLEDVHAFQVQCVRLGISWPALNQIVCALRFFYGLTLGQATVPERIAYAREQSKLPVVLSADEVVRFLEAIPSLKSRTPPSPWMKSGTSAKANLRT